MSKGLLYQQYKEKSSQEIFDKIAPTYNLLNRLLSLGIDRFWRRAIIKQVPKKENMKVLDMATGTGDMLFMYSRLKDISSIAGVDLSNRMLGIAKRKIKKKNLTNKIKVFSEDIQNMSFFSNSFHCASIVFGIRNVPDVSKCLSEAYRVLLPNGRIFIMELTVPKNIVIKKIYLIYLRYILPFLGGMVSGHFFAYRYLNNTIEDFPQYKEFCNILKKNNFKNIFYKTFLYGICTLYSAEK